MSANTLDIRVVTDEGKYKGHFSDPETKFQVDFQEEFQLVEPLYSPAQVFGQFSLRNSTLGKQFPGVPEPETQLQLVNKVAVWPLLSLSWARWEGPYLQGSEEDAASNGDTDLIVVVDLSFAVGSKAMYLLENENQNRSGVQVLFNPISSKRGKKRYSGEYGL